MEGEKKAEPTEPPLHDFAADLTSRAKCKNCGMTRGESEVLGSRCVFESVHVNKNPGLVDQRGNPVKTGDEPDGVILWDGAEMHPIDNAGDAMCWVMAAGRLMARAMTRLGRLMQEHKRTDLKHVIRWAINPAYTELHCEMKVRLP